MTPSSEAYVSPPQPRWTAIVAVVAVGAIFYALPHSLRVGPAWLLLVLVVGLCIPTAWSHRIGRHDINQVLGYLIAVIETLAIVASVGQLVVSIAHNDKDALELLRGAALLWVANVLIFALWYWRIDAGGPHHRDARPGHPTGDFLFPQMTIQPDDPMWDKDWSPTFIDYVFLAFNTSTALSPTDVPVFSPRAKLLMMIQALISLTLIVIVAARAVNVL